MIGVSKTFGGSSILSSPVRKRSIENTNVFLVLFALKEEEKEMKYIDMHCDTLAEALSRKKNTVKEVEGTMVDLIRLREAGASAQFFAMFVPQGNHPDWFGLETMPDLDGLLLKLYQIYQNTMESCNDIVAPARSYEAYLKNQQEGKISAFLTIENGAPVAGKMENIKKFHDMGVGLMTLTWNDPNCFGQNHSKDPEKMKMGLTEFGKEAITYMNELGMIVDVSHLSDGGFYDVAQITKKPFVASHSNCRELSPATRNLTDDMIRILAEKGGVAGINFEPSFVNASVDNHHCTVARLCDHIEHLRQVGGEDCVGIGTDFDGISGTYEIEECNKMHLLFEEMERRNYGYSFIEKVAHKNVERVIKESMK